MKYKRIWVGAGVFAITLILFMSLSAMARDRALINKPGVLMSEFAVQKMTCGGCLSGIDRELKKHPGYLKLGGNVVTGRVYVAHTDILNPEAIARAIKKAGYPAEAVSTAPMDTVDKKDRKVSVKSTPSCCAYNDKLPAK